jgi:hypothetical protein
VMLLRAKEKRDKEALARQTTDVLLALDHKLDGPLTKLMEATNLAANLAGQKQANAEHDAKDEERRNASQT